MHKLIRKLGLGAATAAFVTTGSLAPAMADTVLKFISWQTDDAGTGEWWRSAIAAFEKQHPGVKIECTKAERSSYAATMTTLFAANQPPQIVHLASFEFQMFADSGWLEPLDPWLKKDGIDMTGSHRPASVRAELLVRSGRTDEARAAYDEAIELCRNEAELAHLRDRHDSLA